MTMWKVIEVFGLTMMSISNKGTPSSSINNNNKDMDRRQALVQSSSSILSTATITAGCSFLSGSPQPASAAATTATASIVTLSDGTTRFPLASFGLQIYDDATAYKLTLTALEVGYRNFFSSVLTGNQRGFAKAIRDSGIPRDELFICGSVVSNRASGYENALKATTKGWKENMEAFGVGGITYLDQIMLDYPGPDCASIQGQWAAFQEMYDQKLTKTLSVSNFNAAQLDCILKDCRVKPVVNQLPYSVAYHPGSVVKDNTEERGILVQAWAPLGGSLGGRFSSSIKGKCEEIGKKYQKSWAQVALRWIVQTGASFSTQTKKKEHFQEDLNIFDFELTAEEVATLSALA